MAITTVQRYCAACDDDWLCRKFGILVGGLFGFASLRYHTDKNHQNTSVN